MKKRKTVAEWARENMPDAVPGDISVERLLEIREALRNWRQAYWAYRAEATTATIAKLTKAENELNRVAEREANNGND